MIQALLGTLVYAVISLVWTPDATRGLHNLITIGMALATAIALLLLVRSDRRNLGAFAGGALLAGGLQVGLAAIEVTSGYHVTRGSVSANIEPYGLENVEQLYGSIAWGTMFNPNDLGGFLLLTTTVFFSATAYGLDWGRGCMALGYVVVAVSIWIGLTSLADARAYRLGMVVLVTMHALDRLFPPSRSVLRILVMLLLGWALLSLVLIDGGAYLAQLNGPGDAVRKSQIATAFSVALLSGGFGRGLGTEMALIESGDIPTNFHNVVAQLAAELGLVVSAAFVIYLLTLVISWAFASRSTRGLDRGQALGRATLASALLFYGVSSSGVLESPIYWTFFAATALLSVSVQGPSDGDGVSVNGDVTQISATWSEGRASEFTGAVTDADVHQG